MVMRNIKVLAIDQNTEPKSQQPAMVGSTATLEIPPRMSTPSPAPRARATWC